jgi:hypothetical protein
VLYGLGAAALFGMSVPLAKILVPTTGAVMLAALLYLGAGLGVTVLSALLGDVREGRESGLTRADTPQLLGVVLGRGVGRYCSSTASSGSPPSQPPAS